MSNLHLFGKRQFIFCYCYIRNRNTLHYAKGQLMNYKRKRQQIATALAENPADALQLALELVVNEPNESVNYKNLAICYAYNDQVTKARATLDLGEKKTKAKK